MPWLTSWDTVLEREGLATPSMNAAFCMLCSEPAKKPARVASIWGMLSDSPSRICLQSFFEYMQGFFKLRNFKHICKTGMVDSLARCLVE